MRQEGIADCAAACVAMVLSAFGKSMSVGAIRAELQATDATGTTADAIVSVLLHHGLEAWGTLGAPDDVGDVAPPAILHWRSEHFVVLEEVSETHVAIIDPTWGARRHLDLQNLRKLASGLVLHVRRLDSDRP